MVFHSYRHKLTVVITSLAVLLVVICIGFFYWYTYRIVMSEISRNLKNSAEMIRLAITDEDLERVARLHAMLAPYIHYTPEEIKFLKKGGIVNNIPKNVIEKIEAEEDFQYLVNKVRKLAIVSGTTPNNEPPKFDIAKLKHYVAEGVVVPYIVVIDEKYKEYPMSQTIIAAHYKTNADFIGNPPGTTWKSFIPMGRMLSYPVYVNDRLYKDVFYTALYSCTALYDKNGKIIAFLGLDYPAGGEIEKLANLGMVSFALILLSIVSGFVISYYMSKRLSRSLIKLTEAAGDITNKNYNVAVEIDQQDEFGKLGVAFNNMAFAVKHTTDELEKINERLISITADMHDGAGAVLSSILIATKNKDAKIEDIHAMAKSGVSEIRFLMDAMEYDLCTFELLSEGITLIAVDILQPNNISWEILADENSAVITFQMYLDMQRIARECFTNIIKHSDADKCFIELHMADGVIILNIRDNGKPLDACLADSGGKGLQNIKYRAERHMGACNYMRDETGFSISVIMKMPN